MPEMNREGMVLDDNAIGRARVKDTPDIIRYYSKVEQHDARAFWTVANDIEPWFPRAHSVPTIWKYSAMRPLLIEAADLVSAEDAARRVLLLENPNRRNVSAAVGWLVAGLQIMRPHEATSAHKHMASALRFVMEGTGAYTVVDGALIHAQPRDFLLTPSGCWHDHGNRSSDGPVIWQDGLDLPLVNALEANYFAIHPAVRQRPGKHVNALDSIFGNGGLLPADRQRGRPSSPLGIYPWDKTYEALQRLSKVADGSAYDGIIMEYVNPLTGGSVMPTMSAHMQMLRPSEHTKAHRHTGNVIYHVAKGNGFSVIDGQRFKWEERDIFCVPSWALHEHANNSDTEDACLFSYNDFPVMHSLGMWLEEAYAEHDGRQTINDLNGSGR